MPNHRQTQQAIGQYLTRVLSLLVVLILTLPAYAKEDIWLLIDTEKLELIVKSNDITLAKFSNISIGRNGSGFKRQRGDNITPLGHYKIAWINPKSHYNLFFGFNYPSIENAQQALEKNLLNRKTYNRIISAHKNNQLPPQHSPLGGLIGIHGLGRADKIIHEMLNWTHGCIALNNEQINKLATFIKKDTIVIVE